MCLSYVCTHVLPNYLQARLPKSSLEMICKVAQAFLLACSHLGVKQSAVRVTICPGPMLAVLDSSLGLVRNVIARKYFSMESFARSCVFLMLSLVNDVLI